MKRIALAALALSAAAGLAALAGDDRPVSSPIKLNSTAIIDGKEVPAPAIPMGDAGTIAAIIKEGSENSQVMAHLDHLTHKIGPRLTGSTRQEQAAAWCKSNYEKWGLANPHMEEWGTIPLRFDRGPSSGKVLLRDERKKKVTKPDGTEGEETEVNYTKVRDMEFSTPSWSKGTEGPVRGPVFWVPTTEDEYNAIKGKLKGAWLLSKAPAATGQRGVRSRTTVSAESRAAARQKVADGAAPADIALPERCLFDGIAGFITTGRDERVWTGAVSRNLNAMSLDKVAPDIAITVRLSDYDFINSRLADGEPVELEFDLQHTFTPGPIPVYNTIAEIKGSEKPDEIVIISAHMDSWDGPGSQGCTDNGTGTSVTLEAARILAAVGAKPKRTIRFINWSGEEQGLLGSRAYVKAHESELSRISAVFVDDGGTNYEGGLPAAENMVEYLAAATAPVNNQFFEAVVEDGKSKTKFLNVNIRNTGKRIDVHGSSDHASFNQVGVPGFFWDEVGRADYGYGWHTQNDKFELAIPEYLKQSATCAAVTAYNLACAPDLLPRIKKDEPKPEAPKPEAKKTEEKKDDAKK